jgi:hypothetical protein
VSMNHQYSVEIVARGEGLVYREGARTLNFDLYWNRDTRQWVFHAYACSDSQFHPVQLSSEDRRQIVTRIADYLESRGDKVQILEERPPEPLRSAEEIADQRFPRRGAR